MKNQINNVKGNIIKVVNSNHTGTAYDFFENGMVAAQRMTISDTIDKDFTPEIAMNFNDLNDFLQLNLLQSKNPEFEISEDVQNWAIKTGSTGKDTILRLFFPASLVNENALTDSPLGLLFSELAYLTAFGIRYKSGTIQYFEEIDESQKTFLQNMYPEILFEYKNGSEPVILNINPV